MGSLSDDRRTRIVTAYKLSRDYEEPLTNTLIDGLSQITGVSIYGITNPNRVNNRVPTVSIRVKNVSPSDMTSALASKSIHVWHGHNYAYEPARALNLPLDEGVVRIGLAHYNTIDEVKSVVAEIHKTVTKAN